MDNEAAAVPMRVAEGQLHVTPAMRLRQGLVVLPFADSLATLDAICDAGVSLGEVPYGMVVGSLKALPASEIAVPGKPIGNTLMRALGRLAEPLDEASWAWLQEQAATSEIQAAEVAHDLRTLLPGRRASYIKELLDIAGPSDSAQRQSFYRSEVLGDTHVSILADLGGAHGAVSKRVNTGYRQAVRYASPDFIERLGTAKAKEVVAAHYEPGQLLQAVRYMPEETRRLIMPQGILEAKKEDILSNQQEELLTLRLVENIDRRQVNTDVFPDWHDITMTQNEDDAVALFLSCADRSVLMRLSILTAPSAELTLSRTEMEQRLLALPSTIRDVVLEHLAVRAYHISPRMLHVTQAGLRDVPDEVAVQSGNYTSVAAAKRDRYATLRECGKVLTVADIAAMEVFSGKEADVSVEEYLEVAAAAALVAGGNPYDIPAEVAAEQTPEVFEPRIRLKQALGKEALAGTLDDKKPEPRIRRQPRRVKRPKSAPTQAQQGQAYQHLARSMTPSSIDGELKRLLLAKMPDVFDTDELTPMDADYIFARVVEGRPRYTFTESSLLQDRSAIRRREWVVRQLRQLLDPE